MKLNNHFITSAAFMLIVSTAGVATAQGRGAGSQGRGTPPPTPAAPAAKPTTPTTPTTPPTTAAERLAMQPQLAAKLQPLLPPGTNLQVAATGFKNLGQFVAAAHVSSNLGIPFDQLKARMTGPKAESLGQAIHDLKPDVNSAAEAKKADSQAKKDQSGRGHQ